MRRLAMLVLTAALLVGCGSASTQESAASPADPAPTPGAASPASSAAAPVDGDAPFGTVPAVGGGQIDGGDLAGRDLALWFWAPW